jgi:hypothetical protein
MRFSAGKREVAQSRGSERRLWIVRCPEEANSALRIQTADDVLTDECFLLLAMCVAMNRRTFFHCLQLLTVRAEQRAKAGDASF